eukprot:CAMPEP_0174931826 /NCGR_PEP_ID=MMETSP1355-20121228/35085_1 /TAXON_ID=464990 /ORGANISM="Hemiselmis tepida, Strain CCMP443" /LENGTH=39 /DNA_ID= /DNA_START= /DNA_END= /DNA_ORIENTATION=
MTGATASLRPCRAAPPRRTQASPLGGAGAASAARSPPSS